MDENYNYNNFDNCLILYDNSESHRKKYKKLRITSPVLIQSYGKNNFAVELINDIKQNFNERNYNGNDYMRSGIKRVRKYKTSTNFVEISPDKYSIFHNSQKSKPISKYYNNYTNINFGHQNINSIDNVNHIHHKKKYYIEKKIIDVNTYNYKIYKKEDVDELFFPSEKKNLYDKNRNKTEYKYQRFSESFISKNCSLNKRIFVKDNNNNNHINNNLTIQKKESYSKSKNQLDEFNIDKLKEIGDNFALKCFNRIKQQKKLNKEKKNINININNENMYEKEEKENIFINNMLNIEQKRRNSKNKMNLINKYKHYKIKKIEFNNTSENENKIKTINDNSGLNEKLKIIKITKKNKELLKNTIKKNLKKLKINRNTIRNRYKIKTFSGMNDLLNNDYYSIGNQTTKNKILYNINNNNQIFYKINEDKKNLEIQNDKNNYNSRTIFDLNSNKRININNIEEKKPLKMKNSNNSYLESLNIKNQKIIKKTLNSFNNIFLP